MPATIASARLQASQGNKVTNLRGETVTLDDIHNSVLRHLDGSRNRSELIDSLVQFMIDGGHRLNREKDNAEITDPAEMRELLDSAIDKILLNLGAKALLLRPS
jgi:methyltransferase-like protein